MLAYHKPYVNIPGSRVQHLVNNRDPWRWLTTPGGERYSVPRGSCSPSAYNQNRDDAVRTGERDSRRPLCKSCVANWEWEAFNLQRRSMMMSEVLFGCA
jgi:hypothetical protein